MPCAALAAPPAGETERRLKALTVKRKRKPVGGGGEVWRGQHAFEGDASRAQALISVFRFHIFVAAPHTHVQLN